MKIRVSNILSMVTCSLVLVVCPLRQAWSYLVTISHSILLGIELKSRYACEIWPRMIPLLDTLKFFNPFVPNVSFLYPLKTWENLTIFWCFQGAEKECIGNEWVKIATLNVKKIWRNTSFVQSIFNRTKSTIFCFRLFKVFRKSTFKIKTKYL